MGGFRNSVLGGINLIRAAIRSPNYQAGVQGWTINQDGSAEFNNLSVRGTYSGTDYIINAAGIFLYSGPPANGNLSGSWAAAAGTDAYGNAYQAGLTIYGPSTAINLLGNDVTLTASNGTTAVLESGLNAALYLKPAGGPWSAGALYSTVGGGSHPAVEIASATDTINGIVSSIILQGSSSASVQTSILSQSTFWSHTGDLRLFGKGQVQTAWVKQDNNGNAFTWQPASSLGTGWASGPSAGTVQACQYRLDAEDNLIIVGTVHSTTTTPAATIFTLPAGYRPAVTQRSPGVSNSGGTATARYVEVNSSGAVSINSNLTTSGTDVYFQVSVPMGTIA